MSEALSEMSDAQLQKRLSSIKWSIDDCHLSIADLEDQISKHESERFDIEMEIERREDERRSKGEFTYKEQLAAGQLELPLAEVQP